jgi:hypothetical protein
MITETDIANRALQRVGTDSRIAAGALWTEDSKNAAELRVCYDMVRKSELRRNIWRYAIHTELLRARTSTTNILLFSTWDASVKYEVNDRVILTGKTWISIGSGINKSPDARTYDYWVGYFGSDTADVYSSTTTYSVGEQVYSGTIPYISVADNNIGNLVTDTAYWLQISIADWVQLNIYDAGNRAVVSGVTYVSLQASNQNHPPASSPTWWSVTSSQVMALSSYTAPIPSGSNTASSGRNVFRLPKGFHREAPQAPKQGSYLPLGAPAGLPYSDWVYENNYFTTQLAGPIAFRFVADVEDPNDMDPMFVDGFSARLALEICESISQSGSLTTELGGIYNKFMTEARAVNGIETGPTEPPEDAYISCRT